MIDIGTTKRVSFCKTKYCFICTVVVAQLSEQLLLAPEDPASNPFISNVFIMSIVDQN